ncbi:TetR/AcrR family transcriptional regulator [Roseiflexus sp.]|uniref:TetR/AcrR family transcriptional regulator n=1 Tax=Roseiflexus sp. TaxID=2562120 RepID=UPI0021DBB4D5|nr:TetR/AcrR family transcriptional regulator [Roseiflexus sp.]GIW01212.1 MAG: TetR family transcriptional regulator [Roseiflexus sp.]
MDGPSHEATGSTVERILTIAATLFAEHGYHGLSMRTLAAAVGLNIATIHYHVSSKQELYKAVFRRLAERERALIAAYTHPLTDDDITDPVALQQRLNALVDALVDLTIEQPETPRLWLRRWLERDESPVAVEAEVSLPLYDMVLTALERAQSAGTITTTDIDLRLILTSFVWILYGYFAGSPLDATGARVDPTNPERVAAFKRFLHVYTARMLGLPDNPGIKQNP